MSLMDQNWYVNVLI